MGASLKTLKVDEYVTVVSVDYSNIPKCCIYTCPGCGYKEKTYLYDHRLYMDINGNIHTRMDCYTCRKKHLLTVKHTIAPIWFRCKLCGREKQRLSTELNKNKLNPNDPSRFKTFTVCDNPQCKHFRCIKEELWSETTEDKEFTARYLELNEQKKAKRERQRRRSWKVR